MSEYTVVHCNEDGEATLEVLDRDVLESRLNEGYYGAGVHALDIYVPNPGKPIHLNCVAGLYIIPAAPVKPDAVEVVTKFRL